MGEPQHEYEASDEGGGPCVLCDRPLTAHDPKPVKPCRWSYANSMSFAFCVTHSDYHKTFLTPPIVCPTAAQLSQAGEKPND